MVVPAAISGRHCLIGGSGENMSRTPVMPLAMKSGKKDSLFHSWTCMSQRPGIRYLPVASITCAPCGSLISPTLPSAIICAPSISTVISDLARPTLTSITVTCVRTSGRDDEVVTVCPNTNPGKRRMKSIANIFLIS
jgi:hypothetical protein